MLSAIRQRPPWSRETVLSAEKIAEAYTRISVAVTDDDPVTVSGVICGAQVFWGGFEFQPDTGDLVRGHLEPELEEEERR